MVVEEIMLIVTETSNGGIVSRVNDEREDVQALSISGNDGDLITQLQVGIQRQDSLGDCTDGSVGHRFR